MRKFIIKTLLGIFFSLGTLHVQAENQVVLIDGAVRVFLDRSKNQLQCIGCGSTDEIKARAVLPIVGQLPLLSTYSLSYFADRGLIVLRTDLANNKCPSGKFSVIDLETRITKSLSLPSCEDPVLSYFIKNGKMSLTFVQDKKTTRFNF